MCFLFFLGPVLCNSWRQGVTETQGVGQRLEVTQKTAFLERASGHEQAPGFAELFSFLATRYKLIYLVRKTWFIAI